MIKNERKIVLKLNSKLPGEKFTALEELEEEAFNYSYLTYSMKCEVPSESGIDYYIIFDHPEGYFSLLTIFKYLMQ